VRPGSLLPRSWLAGDVDDFLNVLKDKQEMGDSGSRGAPDVRGGGGRPKQSVLRGGWLPRSGKGRGRGWRGGMWEEVDGEGFTSWGGGGNAQSTCAAWRVVARKPRMTAARIETEALRASPVRCGAKEERVTSEFDFRVPGLQISTDEEFPAHKQSWGYQLRSTHQVKTMICKV